MAKIANWQKYAQKVDKNKWLKSHRDWVEQNEWGFGDRALHWMWYELAQQLPDNAKMLEIGVYKGQVLSLWRLISNLLKKDFRIYGLTPLESTTDKYHVFPEYDYRTAIKSIHHNFNQVQPHLIKGYSTDPEIVKRVPRLDLLYIDGGHDEPTIRNDIEKFVPKVKKGGLIVFDDASCNLPDYGHWYKGLDEVSKVVDEFALTAEEVLVCGHNRVFRR